jgi:solute carrier family 39 (zinc transporter), member 1/2/3
MPGVIMMASLFALFVIEMWLNSKMGGHSHGGAKGFEQATTAQTMAQMGISGPAPAYGAPQRPPRPFDSDDFETDDDIAYQKKLAQKMYEDSSRAEANRLESNMNLSPSEMPPWFVVFYEQYVRQRLEMMNMIKQNAYASGSHAHGGDMAKQQPTVVSKPIQSDDGPVDPLVYKKMSMNITLLEGGILFHSIFVGMTISITIEGFIILLVAILFHQMFEGLGLGSRIAAVPYPKGSIRPWLLVVAFGTTAPIGQAIGLVARNSYDPNSAFGLIIVGVFNSDHFRHVARDRRLANVCSLSFLQLFRSADLRCHCRPPRRGLPVRGGQRDSDQEGQDHRLLLCSGWRYVSLTSHAAPSAIRE